MTCGARLAVGEERARGLAGCRALLGCCARERERGEGVGPARGGFLFFFVLVFFLFLFPFSFLFPFLSFLLFLSTIKYLYT